MVGNSTGAQRAVLPKVVSGRHSREGVEDRAANTTYPNICWYPDYMAQ